ncbi:MAG: hypothetical protein GKR94_01215 [Gammaproteobacteria bacterium]|nr:hypothetical protein [Gammaproteobacteria bacterium]
MNGDTKNNALPSLVEEVLTDPKHCLDNLFADTWNVLKFNRLIKAANFTKRSGIEITQAVFLL